MKPKEKWKKMAYLMMNKCTDEELDVFLAALREMMKHKR